MSRYNRFRDNKKQIIKEVLKEDEIIMISPDMNLGVETPFNPYIDGVE